jgi:hypothetical protein
MRINLFSGPGCGKSTLAAWLFSQLKVLRPEMQVEQVSEYIKGWAWEKRVPQSWDQFYIFGKQLHHEDKVLRHGVHVVTDSPLLLQIAYIERQGNEFVQECLSVAMKFDQRFPSMNIRLLRDVPYQQEGRYENLAQAQEMDERITTLLKRMYSTRTAGYATFSPLDRDAILEYVLLGLDNAQPKAA